jgi:UrcA family protein
MNTSIRGITLLGLSFIGSGAALAGTPDLSTPDGARAARAQLIDSARRLCNQTANNLGVHDPKSQAACVEEAMSAAVRQVVVTEGVAPRYKRRAAVSLAGLDLSTPEGMRSAEDRLHKTAQHLCSQVTDTFSRSAYSDYMSCVKQAQTDAWRRATIDAQVATRTNKPAPLSKP